jgi:MFS family permease
MTAPAARPPILNRALLLVFVASFGAMTGFYLLLSVVPLYAESVGAGGVGAGLVTGALMATTVAGELAIPRLLARCGHRAVLAAGLVLLGAPALALLIQAVGATLSRWWAGRFGDRNGPAVLFVPGVVTAAAGILALVLIDRPVAVLAAMALFGAGFGATQNASMTLMLNRVAPSAYGTVSAIWNLAYDAGIGVGAFGFGVVAAHTGYPPAFALTAALMLAALALRPARPDRPVTTGPS